jgi:iduronate 2-sulfatase
LTYGPQRGRSTDAFFELVDLWPTIAELAGVSVPPLCPPQPQVMRVLTCTEGYSAAAVVRGVASAKTKRAAFSQYSRPSLQPQNSSELPDLKDIRYMGYTMKALYQGQGVADGNGTYFRYTEWRSFDPESFRADWQSEAVATEMYNHASDPSEDDNLCFAQGRPNHCGAHVLVRASERPRLRCVHRFIDATI